jgi:hypothetical protein
LHFNDITGSVLVNLIKIAFVTTNLIAVDCAIKKASEGSENTAFLLIPSLAI